MRIYFKRLQNHPGVPIAAALSVIGPAVALSRPDGDWRIGLVMLIVWVPVLITAVTQPIASKSEGSE